MKFVILNCTSCFFSIFTVSYQLPLIPEYFHHPNKKLCTPQHSSFLSSSSPWQSLLSFFTMDLPILDILCTQNRTIYYFCVWLLGGRFIPFITLSISCHPLLTYRVSAENSADNLMGVLLYVICCISFVAFNIFFLSLIFISLTNMCLIMFLLGRNPVWDSLCFLDLSISFPTLGKFLAIIYSNIFSGSFFSPSGTSII